MTEKNILILIHLIFVLFFTVQIFALLWVWILEIAPVSWASGAFFCGLLFGLLGVTEIIKRAR
jgi:hypothetical protein